MRAHPHAQVRPAAGRRPRAPRDRGSVIVMVLVLMIIGSLMVLPLLQYAQVVIRQNTVLSDRTQRIEAVKGGLRTALADPAEVYRHCSEVGSDLASASINGMTVHNTCQVLSAASALSEDQLRFGVATTQLGHPEPPELIGDKFPHALPVDDPGAPSEWYASTSLTSETDKIMYPNLPVYGTSPRSPLGSQMPTAAGFPECTVFFPGKYVDPITIDGPTYFVNGVYYFTKEVRIVGGADVVVGDGNVTGCTTSQEAIFFATPPPSGSHNVNGVGATWVLGDAGRVVVDNTSNNLPISLIFNKRYVAPGEWGNLPANDVAIMSVNGDPEQINTTAADGVNDDLIPAEFGHYLLVDGLDPAIPVSMLVPESYVGANPDDLSTPANETLVRRITEPASAHGYVPSIYTPKLRPPDPPAAPTVTVRNHGALVTWTPPVSDGGRKITTYTVTAAGTTGSSQTTCVTHGTTSCGFNPIHGTAVTFSVVATTPVGDSDPSLPSAVANIPESGAAFAAPGVSAPTVAMQYDDAVVDSDPFHAGVAHVTWSPPTDGGLPITSYEVFLRRTPLVEDSGDGSMVGLSTPQPEEPELLCETDPAPETHEFDDMTVTYVPDSAPQFTPELVCDFTGLNLLDRYEIGFRSTNAVGESAPNSTTDIWVWDGIAGNIDELVDVPDFDPDGDPTLPDSDPATPMVGDGFLTPAELTAYLHSVVIDDAATDRNLQPHHPDDPTSPEHHAPVPPFPTAVEPPTPIIEFRATNPEAAATVTIEIPSYIAVPMGRILVDNPLGRDLNATGGVLAARIDLTDSRAAGPETVPIGFEEALVQFTFRIDSWVDTGSERSRAVVQINQNGAYAVNSWEVQ